MMSNVKFKVTMLVGIVFAVMGLLAVDSFAAAEGVASPVAGGGAVSPSGGALPKAAAEPEFIKECKAAGHNTVELAPLPNTLRAVREHKSIKILTIGAPSLVGDSSSPDYQRALEDTLQHAIKGLSVEVVNRGVSGELVSDAAERLKSEVALVQPDLVLWQVGTADALARVPVGEFRTSLRRGLRWLKARHVDVILVGAKYSRRLKKDRQYQALRRSVFRVAKEENVLRISQYRAMEAMERQEQQSSLPVNAIDLSEDVYSCVAEYAAQSVIARWAAQGPTGGRQSKGVR